MRLFGTDGIRGKPGEGALTRERIIQITQAFGQTINGSLDGKALICRDTRQTGNWMQRAAETGLSLAGINVSSLGILNSPAAAYLAVKHNMAAVVITASHNPSDENGIKFFTDKGIKLTRQEEERIEELAISPAKGTGRKGRITKVDWQAEYESFAAGTGKGLKGLKAVLDCSNGAASKTAEGVMKQLKVAANIINNKPDGKNINLGCGSENPGLMASLTIKKKDDIGIALDGDADRVVLADERGKVLSGDQVIGICAIGLKEQGLLSKDKIVVTEYSNSGLEHSLLSHGIKIMRSDVGDQNVAFAMRKEGLCLGGEQSGHIIFSRIMPTGDGIISAIQVMNIMQSSGKKLSELAAQIETFPQVTINVPVKEKKPLEGTSLQKKIDSIKLKGRIFVRYSGTQNLLRIMVEGQNEKQINTIAIELEKEARKL